MDLKDALFIYASSLLPVGSKVLHCGADFSLNKPFDTFDAADPELDHIVSITYQEHGSEKSRYIEFKVPYFEFLNSLIKIASEEKDVANAETSN